MRGYFSCVYKSPTFIAPPLQRILASGRDRIFLVSEPVFDQIIGNRVFLISCLSQVQRLICDTMDLVHACDLKRVIFTLQ